MKITFTPTPSPEVSPSTITVENNSSPEITDPQPLNYPTPSFEDHSDLDSLIMAIRSLISNEDIIKPKEPRRFQTIREFLNDTN